MTPTMSARRVLALVCALGIVAAAGTALADDDAPKSGYLGVHLQDIDSSLAKALQLEGGSGVLISDVVDDGPAAGGGMEDGDVVLEFAGRKIETTRDLTRAVRRTEPGEKVEVVILRAGQRKTLEIEVGEREKGFVWVGGDDDLHLEHFFGDDDEANVFIERLKDGDDWNVRVSRFHADRGYLGVQLDDLNEQLGEYFEVEDGAGALVTGVIDDSAAQAAGLRAGDVIVRIGDEDIASAADVHEALAGTEVDQEIEVTVKRRGKTEKLDVKLGELPEDFRPGTMRFFGDGDHEFHIVAPKMLRSMPHMKRQMRIRSPEHIEIIREHEDVDGDLEEVRGELEKLREELKELKKELKK